jgi:20S proteasome alpha/beta subunit
VLAEALRKGPYEVQCLIAGHDHEGCHLYWLDYLGTCQKTHFGAHGYAGYFISSVLNNFWEKVGPPSDRRTWTSRLPRRRCGTAFRS